MDLGSMLEEALERHGFAMPSGSGVAKRELAEAAEEFLRAVREAEAGASAEPPAGGDAAGPSPATPGR